MKYIQSFNHGFQAGKRDKLIGRKFVEHEEENYLPDYLLGYKKGYYYEDNQSKVIIDVT